MGKYIKVIYNPNAGIIHPVNLVKNLVDRFFPKNLCTCEFELTESKGHATVIAKNAVEQNFDIVVAIGGDGTINEVANALINTNVSMGIVPIGSGNGLARSLGIPLSLSKAIRLVTVGDVRVIDIGKVNEHYFFATAGFGLDAMIGKRFDESRIRGPAPYYLAGIKELLTYEPSEYEIYVDEKSLKVKALLVAVANVKQYGINAIIAPSAKPDDGLLDLCVFKGDNVLSAIVHIPKLFTGQIDKVPEFIVHKGTSFTIIREKAEIYQLDGEVVAKKEKKIDVSIVSNALKIIVDNINY